MFIPIYLYKREYTLTVYSNCSFSSLMKERKLSCQRTINLHVSAKQNRKSHNRPSMHDHESTSRYNALREQVTHDKPGLSMRNTTLSVRPQNGTVRGNACGRLSQNASTVNFHHSK